MQTKFEVAGLRLALSGSPDVTASPRIDIGPAVAEKMKLDAEKYPLELAKGSAVKYSKL